MKRRAILAGALLLSCAGPAGAASDKFFLFNDTTVTDLTGVWLAPAGTLQWGKNQALNDPDKVLDHGERLRLTGLKRGHYDAKFQVEKGGQCVKRGIDLTHDTTFDVRDADLAACQAPR